MTNCNCIAPIAHHAKCGMPAAPPSSLCEACQTCWELAGECAAPDVPEVAAEPVKDEAAPSPEEALGI
jgi:hypothetical protein